MSNLLGASRLAALSRNVAILTCMDTRVNPIEFLGLYPGKAHIIRNAGGRATGDAIRSLVASIALLDTPEVLIIHHTDCAMGRFTNEQLREKARRRSNVDVSSLDFMAFTDLDESVREDVSKITSSSFIDGNVVVTGYVYDLSTSQLREVCRR